MRRKGQVTTLQERQEIVEKRVAHRLTDSQIAAEMGCSRETVRKWRRRYHEAGRAGLVSKMGRPAGALQNKPDALKDDIRRLRKQYPGWGPQTLLIELKGKGWTDKALPSRSRLATFLKEEGLTRRYQRHTELPQPEKRPITSPHQLWQMDAQGVVTVVGLGKTSLINIIDVASRLKVESYPCVGTTKPGVVDYQLALRRAFLNFGLPQGLSLDHDAAFYQNTSTSPFPMRLHLWLLALGIEVTFIDKPPPQAHAVIERHHQTMEAQALVGSSCSSAAALWTHCDERRAVLNQLAEMKVLAGQSPLLAAPTAVHSGRPYYPQWEEELLCLKHIYTYLAEGKWYRRLGSNGCVMIGRQLYYMATRLANRDAEITFSAVDVAFTCRPIGSEEALQVPARGLSKADLMGDLDQLLNLPTYQLPLPFSRKERQVGELARFLLAERTLDSQHD